MVYIEAMLVSVSKPVSLQDTFSRLESPERTGDKKGHTIIFTRKKQRQKIAILAKPVGGFSVLDLWASCPFFLSELLGLLGN